MDSLSLRHKIRKLIEPTISGIGFDLVAVQWVSGRGRPVLRLSVDGPNGIGADDCARISRELGPLLDAEDPITSAYTLEVSSPGIDRPVQRHCDFEKFKGYKAKIRLVEGAPRRRFTGILGALDEDTIDLTVDGTVHQILLDSIEHAHLVLSLPEFESLRGVPHDDQ